MAFVALDRFKKNSPSTTIAAPGISDSATTIPVAELSVFHDATGLITEGIVISRNNATETATEEIKITGASATSGAGNLTGATRGVSAHGANGAAAVWPAGTLISCQISSTTMNRIKDDLDDLNTNKLAKTANITALNETGIADGEIAVFNLTNKDIRTSDKTFETTLTDDDTKIPTSGAVVDALAAKAPTNPLATDALWDAAGDLVIGTGANTAGKLTKGDAGKVLTAGASTLSWETPTGGASFWTALANFTATPASTSTITMGTDQTATILVGSPLKYTIGGTVYYGMVSAITSNLLTVAGAPLGGDVTALSLGDASRIEQVDIVVNGYYEDADNTALIGSDLNAAVVWRKSKSYAVAYKVWSKVHDSHATHGKATVLINATELNTSADGLTIAADATWYSTVVDIATAAYDINPAEAIEIAVKKGGTGDAHDLVVSIMFVHP